MDKRLIAEINKVKKSDVGTLVKQRIQEFMDLGRRNNKEWFSELSFCILTANSTARLGMKIQHELGADGFLRLPVEELERKLRLAGHRFPNTRAQFIMEARKFYNIKDILMKFEKTDEKREWLVRSVRGIGWKEASHFLRNVGLGDVAILDRHVLRMMYAYGLVDRIPKALTRRRYLDLERRLVDIANKVGVPVGELDLYIWFLSTGEVLK